MSLKKNNEIKICISIVAISFFFIYSAVDHYQYTNFARNTFFYADYFVADKISISGSIPSSKELIAPNQWGKINSLIKLPFQPLLLSILNMVTEVSYSHIYTRFPSWLLIMSGFFIIFRQMRLSLIPCTLLSTAAGLATPVTAYYPVALNSSVKGVMILSVAVLFMHVLSVINSNNINSDRISFALIVVIFLPFIFYWDPEKFFILSLIILFTGILMSYLDHKLTFFFSTIVFSMLLLLQVFELPLGSYIAQLRTAIISSINFDFSNPFYDYIGGQNTGESANTGESSGGGRGFYSIIPLVILFPLAVIGGIYSILDIKRKENAGSIVAVSWGLAALCFSIVYMVAAAGWLAGRSFFFSLPVMFVGSARYLSTQKDWIQALASGLVVILVIVSVVLQLGTPAVSLHNYEPGIETGTDWISKHTTGPVISDHKLGAPIAAKGNFNARYPEDRNKTSSIFYPDTYEEFSTNASNPVIFSEGMRSYGLRAAGSKGPISASEFSTIEFNSNKLYDNGKIILVDSRSQ